jgi:hypothetical protein
MQRGGVHHLVQPEVGVGLQHQVEGGDKSDHGPSVATTVSGSNGTCPTCRLSHIR